MVEQRANHPQQAGLKRPISDSAASQSLGDVPAPNVWRGERPLATPRGIQRLRLGRGSPRRRRPRRQAKALGPFPPCHRGSSYREFQLEYRRHKPESAAGRSLIRTMENPLHCAEPLRTGDLPNSMGLPAGEGIRTPRPRVLVFAGCLRARGMSVEEASGTRRRPGRALGRGGRRIRSPGSTLPGGAGPPGARRRSPWPRPRGP